MAKLKVETKALKDGVTLVSLDGELDAHTSPSLEKVLEELFAKASYNIIIELQNLKYISSHGVGVLMAALSDAQDGKGNIVLTEPTPLVAEVFRMLDVPSIFHLAPDRSAALAAF